MGARCSQLSWLFTLRLIAVRPGSLTQAAESAPVGAAS